MRPSANNQSRICLDFSINGLMAYCNRAALVDLRKQLDWLLGSPVDEHYECHVLMTLENDASKFDGERPRNAGVTFSEGCELMKDADIDGGEIVDLTFMVVSETELDKLQREQH